MDHENAPNHAYARDMALRIPHVSAQRCAVRRSKCPEAKVLVVYYSRTGTTRSLASALAKMLAADLEEICDCSNREGPGGYLRSAVRCHPQAAR